MLVLFFDDFIPDKWQSIVDDFSEKDYVVMANEIVRLPPRVPFMFGCNIWNLSKEDKIYCFNENAANYLENCPCGQKFSVGFDYKDFERVDFG